MSAPTPSVLEIHSGIVLKGSLSMAKDVILTGKFEGDLQTLGRLTVAPGGIATGTIAAGALVLEPGNLVMARVKVGPPPKTAAVAARATAEEKPADESSSWKGTLQRFKKFALGKK